MNLFSKSIFILYYIIYILYNNTSLEQPKNIRTSETVKKRSDYSTNVERTRLELCNTNYLPGKLNYTTCSFYLTLFFLLVRLKRMINS